MKTKAVKIYKQGEVEELKVEETYIRKTGEDDLVIEHQFCGLNYIDINQRNGLYPLKKLPIEVGMEAAGIVTEIGKNVTNFKPGDKVCHCMNIGSFSKKFVVNQKRVIKLDDKTDLKLAASATLQGLTAQYLLHHSWLLKKDHTLLIHAVSGGVGQLLCQWAKLIGATVIGTVGTKDKENVAKSDGKRLPTTVLKFNRVERPAHPTQKPVELLEWLIKSYTNEGDNVLDNCMGVGSTGIASKKTNRSFIGIELDENYYKQAVEFIQKQKQE